MQKIVIKMMDHMDLFVKNVVNFIVSFVKDYFYKRIFILLQYANILFYVIQQFK